MTGLQEEFDWQPFIGRALALMLLEQSDLKTKSVLERGEYLMSLGLPRKEVALLIGSTDNSLRELARQKSLKTSKRVVG